MDNQIYTYLQAVLGKYRVSDFHLHAGRPLSVRVNGVIQHFEDMLVTQEDLEQLLLKELDNDSHHQFLEKGDIDFAFVADGVRYRASALQTLPGLALVLRVIVTEIPNIDQLGLPPAIHAVLEKSSGLVLVTGATGSGKSTSLAAMIDKINRTRSEHIITIEDPIEFVHKPIKSVISQREVGKDTVSFASALKGALRQDPDIILMGEMRDYETVSMAMTAAETGHLVFGTLHTNGAPETINRIVDVFPAEEQAKARSQLSQSLRLVMTQQLLRRKTGGRVGCFEIMVNTPAIANLIREDKIVQIPNVMQTGAQLGMITMTKYLEMLQEQNIL
jgi:twitching motility protein PilT